MGFSYPVAMMTRAQAFAEAGWPLSQIPGLLEQENFTRPAVTTVYRWTRPGYADRQREWVRANNEKRYTAAATFRMMGSSVTYQTAFAQLLLDEGILVSSIAKVMRVVFDSSPSQDTLRVWLADGRLVRPDGGDA